MSGGVNSVQTNAGAMIALSSLEKTNQQLAVTEKQVSTGYRVADSTDDGAAYAIAQGVRSTVGALTSANQQLGNVQGLLSTTQSGLNSISVTMASMRNVLVKLSDENVKANDRDNYIASYKSLVHQVKTYVQDADYNGKNLIGNGAGTFSSVASQNGLMSGSNGTFGAINVARNETGSTYGIATFGGAELYSAINFTTAQLSSSLSVAGFIAAPLIVTSGDTRATSAATLGGTFMIQMNNVGKGLNTVGSEINFVNNQVSYNSSKIDSLNTGLGAMVDADLAKESAQLTALQIRQQLGTQALSLANQAPQALLSLFK
jgi:flagellin